MRKALNPEIALGFLAATVLWIGVLGWQASYAPADAERRQCEEPASKSDHKTEECKTIWERTTSDPVAFFTFWLVISTIGLGISTGMLWRAGEKQFRLARRTSAIQSRDMRASIAAAETSAIVAGQAADAARKSNEIAQETAERQLRAYLSIEAGHIRDWNSSDPTIVQVHAKNNGQTPAYEVQITAGVMVLPRILPAGIQFEYGFNDSISKTIIHPDGVVVSDARSTAPLSEAEITNGREGSNVRLYVGGIVRYKDAFQKTRATKFLVSSGGKEMEQGIVQAALVGQRIPSSVNIHWEHNPRHNEAD